MPATVVGDLQAPSSLISVSPLKAEGFLQLEPQGAVREIQSTKGLDLLLLA